MMQSRQIEHVATYIGYTDGTFVADYETYEQVSDPFPCGDGQFWILQRLPSRPELATDNATFSDRALFDYPINDAVIRQVRSTIWEYDVAQRRGRDVLAYCTYLVTGESIQGLYQLRLVYFESPDQAVELQSPHAPAVMQWFYYLKQKIREIGELSPRVEGAVDN